jgi:hypothetical protein
MIAKRKSMACTSALSYDGRRDCLLSESALQVPFIIVLNSCHSRLLVSGRDHHVKMAVAALLDLPRVSGTRTASFTPHHHHHHHHHQQHAQLIHGLIRTTRTRIGSRRQFHVTCCFLSSPPIVQCATQLHRKPLRLAPPTVAPS